MTGVRLFLYFLDTVSVRFAVKRALNSEADLVIFDRYIYDELANLTLRNPVIRAYVRLIMSMVPKPDISYLLDADPVQARARKPEYPLEFLQTNRQSYLALSGLVGGMTILAPMPVKEVKRAVLNYALAELPFKARLRENDGGTPSRDSGGKPAKMDRPQIRPAEML
jgi:thymidylate kinase